MELLDLSHSAVTGGKGMWHWAGTLHPLLLSLTARRTQTYCWPGGKTGVPSEADFFFHFFKRNFLFYRLLLCVEARGYQRAEAL